jgi:hypothetical protein
MPMSRRSSAGRRRKPNTGPLIPSEQVQAQLRRLEEIRQNEGLDEGKMLDLIRRMQAGEMDEYHDVTATVELVDRVMAEDDAHNLHLASYQSRQQDDSR